MKQVAIFFILLFIGIVGGFAATELRSLFSSDDVNNSVDSNTELTITALRNSVEKLEEEVDSLNNTIDEQNKAIAELTAAKDNPQPSTRADSSSSSATNQNVQQQLNELRGMIKALEQKLNNKPEPSTSANMNSKKLTSEEEKANRAASMKIIAEKIKKQQEEIAIKHAEKMKKLLGLNDNQYEEIKTALFERDQKQREIFTNKDENNPSFSTERMQEIQNEWEESAKHILTEQQYNEFLKRKLNQVSTMTIYKVSDGSHIK